MSIDTKKLRQAAASVRAFLKPEYGREIAAAADHIDAQAAEIAELQKRDVAADAALKEAASVITDRNAEIAALRQPWRPIETAPKDGRELLCWREDCGQFIASYTSPNAFPMTQAEIDLVDEEALFTRDWFTQWPQALRLDGSETPTHWMPLPAPPVALSGESNG